jgi:PQQ-dependent dehydrogenase (methanol/ethanol family)
MAAVPSIAEPPLTTPLFAGDDNGEWTMPAKNFASTRFSALDEVNWQNVATLTLAFSFDTGVKRGQEAAPLVVGATMYVVTPYPNVLFALDLEKKGALKWKYQPAVEPRAQGIACCDVVNRGASYADGRIYYNTLDGRALAVDASTGALVWERKLADITQGETITMAPLAVAGKVLVGNSGGEYGVRGWLAALDGASGEIVWKAYSTGPDADVLIGENFRPFYPQDRGKDLGVATWPGTAWQKGGGNAWGWISYDPTLQLIYYGTGNPGPWASQQRPGDNKWTAGIFARAIENGEARWFYQWSPHDLFDYDGVNENILVDGNINGVSRALLVRPERNGYIYVLDRTTGEVMSATPYGHITTTTGVDLKTGQLQYNEAKKPVPGRTIRDMCPASPGAKDWAPSAFSPRTGFLYIPHNNLCMDYEETHANYIAGTPYVGAEVRMKAGPGGNRGFFTAWDIVNKRAAWSIPENFPGWSGALATAGDVVFYGTMEGVFKAVDARSGTVLWRYQTDSGVISQPVSYRGPDGHQYIAVLSGVGGWAGAVVSNALDVRDSTAALGFANAVADLPQKTKAGGTLYVFRLP